MRAKGKMSAQSWAERAVSAVKMPCMNGGAAVITVMLMKASGDSYSTADEFASTFHKLLQDMVDWVSATEEKISVHPLLMYSTCHLQGTFSSSPA